MIFDRKFNYVGAVLSNVTERRDHFTPASIEYLLCPHPFYLSFYPQEFWGCFFLLSVVFYYAFLLKKEFCYCWMPSHLLPRHVLAPGHHLQEQQRLMSPQKWEECRLKMQTLLMFSSCQVSVLPTLLISCYKWKLMYQNRKGACKCFPNLTAIFEYVHLFEFCYICLEL